MEHQEKQRNLTELLKLLATTPNGDKYMQFVLHLAEESVTKNTLASLIDNGKLAANTTSSAIVGMDTQISKAECRTLGKLSNGKARRVFTIQKKELKHMPEQIRKLFIANDFVVFYRITPSGYYEARLRRGKMFIEASGKTFETMRQRFIERLQNYCDKINVENQVAQNETTQAKKPMLFTEYAEDWLSIKKQTTKPSTFKEYERSFNVDLKPKFKKKYLHEITRSELQKYLFDIIEEGKNRKAEKLALMLNCIFDMAMEDYGIANPMKKVVLPHYQSKKGSALTREEEQQLIDYCIAHKHIVATDAFLVLLLFGLRRSELKSIEIIDNKWLQCETSKERLGLNVVLRKIPFTPRVKRLLPYIDFEKAKATNVNSLQTRLKRIFPHHHPHELRYTFITRCKESGVNPEVVMMWSGHSEDKDVVASRVNRGYTDFSDDFQLKEAEKVDY